MHPSYQSGLDFTATPGHFKQTQCAAYRGCKQVNGDPVLAVGWAGRLYTEYVCGVYAAGGKDCWDRANLHLYPGPSTTFGAGSTVAKTFCDVRALRAKYGDTDPIWITETGYSSGTYAVDEATQADAMRRLYNRYVTMADVEAVVIHTLRDAATKHYTSQEHPEYGYGVMRTDWSPKPVYCHFARMSGSADAGC